MPRANHPLAMRAILVEVGEADPNWTGVRAISAEVGCVRAVTVLAWPGADASWICPGGSGPGAGGLGVWAGSGAGNAGSH